MRLAQGPARGHVGRRARMRPSRVTLVSAGSRFGEPKVDEAGFAVDGDEDVGRFEIAMDDSARWA